jgi:Zn-finger nucleic acid-binding protein
MSPVSNRDYLRCAHCGSFHFPTETGDGVHIVGDLAGMDCPVCGLALCTGLVGGKSAAYCGNCRGCALGMDDFYAVVERRRAHHNEHDHVPVPFDPEELRRVIHCPRCRHGMDAHPYYGGGNVVVDTCERCGLIWLDAGKLALIERHVPRPHDIESVRDGLD